MSLQRFALTFLAVVSCGRMGEAGKLRFCVANGVHSNMTIQRNCPILDISDSGVECVIGNSRFDCLRRLSANESDFTVLQAEDLLAAQASPEFNVLVTNELRFFENDKHNFEVVALVRNDADISELSHVRGKRLCHPGYETTADWTPAIAQYLVNTLVTRECDPNKTLVEDSIAAASTFFDAACIAGAWTPDKKLDSELKSKYPNLCAICDSPTGCYSGDKYHGREGALLCLTDGMGDIAWVRLKDAKPHFKSLGIDKGDYSYLCPDGSVRSMNNDRPCIWISRPWPVIVARSDVSQRTAELMSTLDASTTPWHGALIGLMENYQLNAINTENLETPNDYLQSAAPGFSSANSRSSCQPSRTIKWCVASNVEDRKCSWLRQASFDYGIEPTVSCSLQPNRTACLDAVKNQQADLFVTTPQEEDIARRRGLKPVLQVFTNDKKDLIKVAAVVKKDSKYRTLQQLKGSKACFTGYRSTGWNAFVSAMRNISGSDWECSDIKAVSNFFAESCVLGMDEKKDSIPHNLISLCEQGGKTRNSEPNTFKCLASGAGDVAFINLETVKQNTGTANQRTWAEGLNSKDFRPICFDDADPESCYLAWTTLGSVMVHQNTSALRNEEIYSALLQMDQLFGRAFKGQTPVFSLYGTFDENHNVIFPEKTQHLQRGISHVRLQRNYQEIVENLVKSPPCSKASFFNVNFILTILCLATVIPSQLL